VKEGDNGSWMTFAESLSKGSMISEDSFEFPILGGSTNAVGEEVAESGFGSPTTAEPSEHAVARGDDDRELIGGGRSINSSGEAEENTSSAATGVLREMAKGAHEVRVGQWGGSTRPIGQP